MGSSGFLNIIRSGAARFVEQLVASSDNCEIITNYPGNHLISCRLPGCGVSYDD